MYTNNNVFSDHKEKFIDSFTKWQIGTGTGMKLFVYAGICNEHILKASVIKAVEKMEVIEFNPTTYYKLKDLKYFNDDLEGKIFGPVQCIKLLRHVISRNELSNEIINYFHSINKVSNDIKHAVKETDPKVKDMDNKLYHVMNWFFTCEGEYNWKEKYFYTELEDFQENFTDNFAGKAAEKISAKLKTHIALDDVKQIFVELEVKHKQEKDSLTVSPTYSNPIFFTEDKIKLY